MRVRVVEASQVAEARRTAVGVSAQLGMSETDSGRVALVATESATNLVKHTSGGELLIRPLTSRERAGVEVLSIDSGPGIRDMERAMQDGHSTTGSPGTGLGAIRRLANVFDFYSLPGKGTIALAQVWAGNRLPETELELGVVCEPLEGERVSGDAWAVQQSSARATIMLADGLGHGPGAAEASGAAVRVFQETNDQPPGRLLDRIHAAIRSTRGVAAAIAELDFNSRHVTYAGVGNISGATISAAGARQMISYNGTLGHQVRKIQEFTYPWPDGSVLLLHSDGVATHWNVDAYPGILARHPGILAALLYRDHRRRRDDVAVVVAKPSRAAQ